MNHNCTAYQIEHFYVKLIMIHKSMCPKRVLKPLWINLSLSHPLPRKRTRFGRRGKWWNRQISDGNRVKHNDYRSPICSSLTKKWNNEWQKKGSLTLGRPLKVSAVKSVCGVVAWENRKPICRPASLPRDLWGNQHWQRREMTLLTRSGSRTGTLNHCV